MTREQLSYLTMALGSVVVTGLTVGVTLLVVQVMHPRGMAVLLGLLAGLTIAIAGVVLVGLLAAKILGRP